MRPFAGFQRKAIVIVPTEEEFKTRFDKRTAEEGEELPEMAMLEMKGIVMLRVYSQLINLGLFVSWPSFGDGNKIMFFNQSLI